MLPTAIRVGFWWALFTASCGSTITIFRTENPNTVLLCVYAALTGLFFGMALVMTVQTVAVLIMGGIKVFRDMQ